MSRRKNRTSDDGGCQSRAIAPPSNQSKPPIIHVRPERQHMIWFDIFMGVPGFLYLNAVLLWIGLG
jgi:hypothetical protein